MNLSSSDWIAPLDSLALERRLLSGQAPHWGGIKAKPLGSLALQLVAISPAASCVLLPHQATAPLLHQWASGLP